MNKRINLLIYITLISFCSAQRDSDAITFPDDTYNRQINSRINNQHNHRNHPSAKSLQPNINNNEIPLSFLQKLNEIDNFEEFTKYLDGQDEIEGFSLTSRFGERNPAVMPKPANCIPTLQPVELKSSVSNDSNHFVFPSCTRVERCGGCCSHSLLSCQPVKTDTLAFQVIVSEYTGGDKLVARDKEIIFVEKHTKCRCDCIIKAENCNVFQEYRKDECRCVCTNLDERRKCERNNETKLWDPNVCRCRCRYEEECTTGSFFDQSKCACAPIPVRRRFAELGNRERQFSDVEQYHVEIAPLGVYPIGDKKLYNKN